jgi:hypothetical protein
MLELIGLLGALHCNCIQGTLPLLALGFPTLVHEWLVAVEIGFVEMLFAIVSVAKPTYY